MKKIFLFAAIIFSLTGSAQVDSSTIKITVLVQARDIEYFTGYTFANPDYELLFDATKAKFRVSNPPTNTTAVTIDTIEAGTWLQLLADLKRDPVAIAASVLSRVETNVRAAGNTWLNNNITAITNAQVAMAIDRRAAGRQKLRRQQ